MVIFRILLPVVWHLRKIDLTALKCVLQIGPQGLWNNFDSRPTKTVFGQANAVELNMNGAMIHVNVGNQLEIVTRIYVAEKLITPYDDTPGSSLKAKEAQYIWQNGFLNSKVPFLALETFCEFSTTEIFAKFARLTLPDSPTHPHHASTWRCTGGTNSPSKFGAMKPRAYLKKEQSSFNFTRLCHSNALDQFENESLEVKISAQMVFRERRECVGVRVCPTIEPISFGEEPKGKYIRKGGP